MVEGAEDIVETDWFSLDDVFPLDRRESAGCTVGNNNPMLDC